MRVAAARGTAVAVVTLRRLDVRTDGGPFVPHSFHESFDAAFDQGLALFGIEDGDPLPAGSDFIVRPAVTP